MTTETSKPCPEQAYWSDVREAAEHFASLTGPGEYHPNTREELNERLHEYCDGSARVIYTWQARECLHYSRNDGYMLENIGAEGAVADGVIQWSAMAFYAYQQDIIEHSDSPDWNTPWTCDRCEEEHESRDEAGTCCPTEEELCNCSDPCCPCNGVKVGAP